MISSLTGSNLAIGVSLILNDGITGNAQRAAMSLREFTSQAERNSATSVRNINAVGAAVGVGAISQMRQWVLVGAEFDKRMKYLESITDSAGTAFDNKVLKERAKQVGMDTMFSTTQIAGSMVTMAQAGQTAEEIHKNIQSVAVLAAATMSDIESTSSYMNDIMIGFNIPASAENSMRVADVITKSINDSNLKLQDFGESMKYIIPTATTLGISLEEVAAMLSAIGNAGIKGSMAGTNLENMFRYLARAAGGDGSGKQGEALKMLGLSPEDLKDANGELKSGAELVRLLGHSMRALHDSDITRFNAAMDLMGVRGGRAGNLLANNFEQFDTFLSGVNNSEGTANKTSEAVMDSLWGTIERLTSSLEALKITFTESIMPALKPILGLLTSMIEGFSKLASTPLGAKMTIIATGLVLVRTGMAAWRSTILTLRLAHNTMTGGVLNNINALTAAQARYNTTVMAGAGASVAAGAASTAAAGFTTAQVMAMGGGAGYAVLGRMKGGNFRVRTPQGGHTIMSPSQVTALGNMQQYATTSAAAGAKPSMFGLGKGAASARDATKFGKFMGGYGGIGAMVGGVALDAGADYVGRDTTAGKVMGVAGSTLSWAGTGAMIGSIIPGIGTAAGAAVGAVGGLLYGLYENLQDAKDTVDQAASQEAINGAKTTLNSIDWMNRAQSYLGLNYGTTNFSERGLHGEVTTPGWNNNWGNPTMNAMMKPVGSNITINIDGTTMMSRVVDEQNYVERIDLGL